MTLQAKSKALPAARRFVFHPLAVMTASLVAALIFALAVIALFEGETRFYLLLYFVPVGVPFVAFLFDRAGRWPDVPWLIDLPVIVLALARMVAPLPLISGHALFLTYALFSTRMWVARLAAAAILAEVVYLKVFAWHDATVIGGVLLGALGAWIGRQLRKKRGVV